jgi:hypothetical protein
MKTDPQIDERQVLSRMECDITIKNRAFYVTKDCLRGKLNDDQVAMLRDILLTVPSESMWDRVEMPIWDASFEFNHE